MEYELLDALQRGNPFAQKRVYDRYAHRLYRLCLRYVREEEDAREVLMNGFLQFFRHIDRVEYRGEQTLEPYLKKIMVNEALQFLRRRPIVWESLDDAGPSEEVGGLGTDDGLHAEELYALIRQLPTGYRAVFNLYALEGYSHAEIARQLGITEGTSKSQLSKARAWLQERVKKHGYDQRIG
jgi:RNA polymerase sigma-70 factor (ECF subfamily)